MKKISREEIYKQLIGITKQLLTESGEPYRREVKIDTSLQALGIDSLGRAELFKRIEKNFNVALPDALLAQAETLNHIADFLDKEKPSLKVLKKPSVITSHGEFTKIDISSVTTLLELLEVYAEKSPNKPHIYFQHENGQEEIITYGQLWQSALQIAFSLKQLGLREGETVAIMLPTHPSFFYTFFGTLLAGGVPVPIYPPFRMHMLYAYAKIESRILLNAEVRILVTFDQAEKLSHALKSFVPSLKHVLTADELQSQQTLQSFYKARGNDAALIQYTSGSTAAPKGVLLTHDILFANIRCYGEAIKVTPEDVAVSWLPLYHDMGLIGMWFGSLYYGVPLILLTPFSFLNRPERWLWAIHYHRGTISAAPNFAYELCISKIDASLIEGLDLSSWRLAANGAEKVYPNTIRKFIKKFSPYGFKKTTLLPVYGLAESTVGLTLSPLDREFRVDYIERKPFEEKRQAIPRSSHNKNGLEFVSCGLPLPGHEIRIIDDANKVLPERHVGTLQFRGPSSMKGYYNNPEATSAIFHEGWWDSGDLAYIAEGELFITGRRKDLIIKTGRNLYPAEIEEITSTVKGVRQGCVVAIEGFDEKQGTEQLIIVAETREKNKNELERIKDNIRQSLTDTLDVVPDHIILVKPHVVPKTSSGKLQRATLKKMYEAGQLGKNQLPAWFQIVKLFSILFMRKTYRGFVVLAEATYTFYMVLLLLLTFFPIFLIVKYRSRDAAAKACQTWAKWILKWGGCPITVEGYENLKKEFPVIYAANHASYIDSLVLLAILPKETRFVTKKELLKVTLLGTVLRKLDYLEVDRMDLSKGIEDTKRIESTLNAGHPILIFPEGTFGYSVGLRPFRLGAFKIATDSQVPISPIALQGTRYVLRENEKLMRPGRITITVCEPIKPQGSEWQDVTQLRQSVRAEIAKFCGEPSLDFIAAETIAPNRVRE